MPTRFDAQKYSRVRLGVPPLQSGYGGKSTSRDLTIPPCGIKDIDRALFDLFDKQLPLQVGGENPGSDLKRVPVIMAAGEKWALNKGLKGRVFKDRNGALILPLITMIRTNITQDPAHDIAGRGINQQTGEIVIRRKLDRTDRDYQQLVNRLLITHQQNLAVNPPLGDPMQLTTLREVGDLAQDPTVQQGGLLIPDRTNNIWETIVVPSPQFVTCTYDITIWTQYTRHMTQIIEMLISSYLPQGNQWRLDTPEGYWFLANVDGNLWTSESNTDDFSQVERIVKYKFVIKVPAYIFASTAPGVPVPIKRYVSSPSIEFKTDISPVGEADSGSTVDDPFLGADDPTLPTGSDTDQQPNWENRRRDQRNTRGTRLYPNEDAGTNPDDPAAQRLPRGTRPGQYKKVTGYNRKGQLVTKLFRVTTVNQFTGESILSPADASLGGLTIVTVED
jgi:hypothetical protein